MTPDPGGLRPLVEAGIPRTCAPRRAPRSLKVTRPTPLYEPQLELDLELDQQTPRKEVRLPAWRALQALYAPDSPRQVVSSGTLCALRVLSGHRSETGDSGAAASDQIHRPARPAMNSFSGRPSHPKPRGAPEKSNRRARSATARFFGRVTVPSAVTSAAPERLAHRLGSRGRRLDPPRPPPRLCPQQQRRRNREPACKTSVCPICTGSGDALVRHHAHHCVRSLPVSG